MWASTRTVGLILSFWALTNDIKLKNENFLKPLPSFAFSIMSEDIEIIADVAVGFQPVSGLSLQLPLISSSTEVASSVPGAIACKKYLCTGSSKSATIS